MDRPLMYISQEGTSDILVGASSELSHVAELVKRADGFYRVCFHQHPIHWDRWALLELESKLNALNKEFQEYRNESNKEAEEYRR